MKRITLCALFTVGALAALSTAGAAVPTRTCSAHDLAPVYVSSTGGAGSVDLELGFRDRGAQPCVLRGYPRVQMLTSSGRPLATSERHASGAYGITVKPVRLRPHGVAYFGIHYAAKTGYGNLRCPTSAALRLTAPGSTEGLVLRGNGGRIQAYGGTVPHLHCGVLHVSAVTAKRFQ